MMDQSADHKAEALEALLDAALSRRNDLIADPDTNVFRLVHGFGDGLPSLNIDLAGPCAVIWSRGERSELPAVVDWLRARIAPEAILHKPGGRGEEAAGRLLFGSLPGGELIVREAGLLYELEPMAAQNLGLFIDARPVRSWLVENSRDAVVVNTFAYTGSLGVAARAGGARSAVQVDLQRAQLERARRNHALNGQAVDDRDIMRSDVFRWLQRSNRQVDGLILDPPPRLPGRRRGDPQAWSQLIRRAAPLVVPGGWLLGLLNRRGRKQEEWEQTLCRIAAEVGVPMEPFWRGTSGADFFEPEASNRLRVTAFRRLEA